MLPDRAALYSMEQPNFEPRVQLKPVSISNGIVWSLNNTILYYIDSATKRIDAFDFDEKRGLISKFIEFFITVSLVIQNKKINTHFNLVLIK